MNWESDGLPYPLYVLSGLLGWNFFNYIVYQGMGSVMESSSIIKKIYFPKMIMPLAKVCVGLVELAVTLLLFVPLMLWFDQKVSWHIIFIPAVIIFNALAGLFMVFFFGSLTKRNRDIYHLVPYIMYFGIWFTPVFFSKDILPANLRFIWYFNPIASVAEGWRWCLFPQWQFDLYFLPALFCIIPLVILGMFMYKRAEGEFSDFV